MSWEQFFVVSKNIVGSSVHKFMGYRFSILNVWGGGQEFMR